jgi:hypothetical protein
MTRPLQISQVCRGCFWLRIVLLECFVCIQMPWERKSVPYTNRNSTVSVNGGGYHLWEVRQDAFVRYMKARAS